MLEASKVSKEVNNSKSLSGGSLVLEMKKFEPGYIWLVREYFSGLNTLECAKKLVFGIK